MAQPPGLRRPGTDEQRHRERRHGLETHGQTGATLPVQALDHATGYLMAAAAIKP